MSEHGLVYSRVIHEGTEPAVWGYSFQSLSQRPVRAKPQQGHASHLERGMLV